MVDLYTNSGKVAQGYIFQQAFTLTFFLIWQLLTEYVSKINKESSMLLLHAKFSGTKEIVLKNMSNHEKLVGNEVSVNVCNHP